MVNLLQVSKAKYISYYFFKEEILPHRYAES